MTSEMFKAHLGLTTPDIQAGLVERRHPIIDRRERKAH